MFSVERCDFCGGCDALGREERLALGGAGHARGVEPASSREACLVNRRAWAHSRCEEEKCLVFS